jgi:hypothetical protein
MQSQHYGILAKTLAPTVGIDWKNIGKRLSAFVFCVAIGSSPLLIVMFGPRQSGGSFVAGYVTAVLTAPFILLGLIRAANTLFQGNWLDSLLGVGLYIALLLLISFAAILWVFL